MSVQDERVAATDLCHDCTRKIQFRKYTLEKYTFKNHILENKVLKKKILKLIYAMIAPY